MFKTKDFDHAAEANRYADDQNYVSHVSLKVDWERGRVYYLVFVTDEPIDRYTNYKDGARIFTGQNPI